MKETLRSTEIPGNFSTPTEWPCLDLVGEIFDLVHGSVVLVGQLSELLLSSLVHLLQVRTFIFGVTESPLEYKKK